MRKYLVSMRHNSIFTVLLLLMSTFLLFGCASDGNDGKDGKDATAFIDASTAPDEILGSVDVVSEITGVRISSPPVVNFTVKTSTGTPIVGIGALWEDSNRFVRFTITKLVPGSNGDPDSWVAYVRDEGQPDYDTGSSLVDNGDGSYTFTFLTDVNNVDGVPYEPTLTHRVAGQIGSGEVALEPQNLVLDFVPAGGTVTRMRNISVMDRCNECHDGLVFHGRRFLVEYCVNCHNPDLAEGEGNMSFMIHRIHAAGDFAVLDSAVSYSDVTYPQDLSNCRKCHNGEDSATPQGDNWKTLPNIAACDGCHDVFANNLHTGGNFTDNSVCAVCHPPNIIEDYHVTPNATPNNPKLPQVGIGVPEIAYDISAVALSNNIPTVTFTITENGTVLDMNNLPDPYKDGTGVVFRWPEFLLAWSELQDGIDEPGDYNNMGETAAQPREASLEDLVANNGVACSSTECTADFSVVPGAEFPTGATLRAVGLQGYLQYDVTGDGNEDYSLHTPSAVMAAGSDDPRRDVVDNEKCASCHEWFEGHGGNRTYNIAICTFCHVPNLSSSGRAINPAGVDPNETDEDAPLYSEAARDLGNSATYTWPEDAQNLKDMIHGIHSGGENGNRTYDYEHVRNRNNGIYYNWSHITFPAEDGTVNCLLCHLEGTYELPLDDGLLMTTVRTTGSGDGLDNNDYLAVRDARDNVPNLTDWVNSPTASTCYYCHDDDLVLAHMVQNGGTISIADPAADYFTLRTNVRGIETCGVCHGAGKSSAVEKVHGLD